MSPMTVPAFCLEAHSRLSEDKWSQSRAQHTHQAEKVDKFGATEVGGICGVGHERVGVVKRTSSRCPHRVPLKSLAEGEAVHAKGMIR